MIIRLTGYFLLFIGIVGIGFFRHYEGSLIPYASSFFIASIMIAVIGFYLLRKSNKTKLSKQESYNQKRLESLKLHGKAIPLTIDNCEVRENSYHEEIIKETYSRVQVFDSLYDPNRNYNQRFVQQAAIIFYPDPREKKTRMTSQSFQCDAERLRIHLASGRLTLYVNKDNEKDYVFDLHD